MAQAKKKAKKQPAPMLISVAPLKRFIKDQADVNVSSEFPEAVNEQLVEMLGGAIERCTGNGRKTLRAVDL